MGINENPKNNKPNNIEARKVFYDWLAQEIKIERITHAERDHAFDDTVSYRSGGVRLIYQNKAESIDGVKDGILQEAGFDKITPNVKVTISSWAYDKARRTAGIDLIDNRAVDTTCYHLGYTFVEKLQTIATKFRQEQADGVERPNLMRQYYDVYCLLDNKEVLTFIGTPEYKAHKAERFPSVDLQMPIADNEAFLLTSKDIRTRFEKRYKNTASLYYKGQPDFDELFIRLKSFLHIL